MSTMLSMLINEASVVTIRIIAVLHKPSFSVDHTEAMLVHVCPPFVSSSKSFSNSTKVNAVSAHILVDRNTSSNSHVLIDGLVNTSVDFTFLESLSGHPVPCYVATVRWEAHWCLL